MRHPCTGPSAEAARAITYQLYIRVRHGCSIAPGRLDRHRLARGWYVYTGSARRNMAARLGRHLSGGAGRRWHIDWLLGAGPVEVEHIVLDARPECEVNRMVDGSIVIPRFGATDCRQGCGSHLLWLGPRRPPAVPRHRRSRHTHRVVARLAGCGS